MSEETASDFYWMCRFNHAGVWTEASGLASTKDAAVAAAKEAISANPEEYTLWVYDQDGRQRVMIDNCDWDRYKPRD